MRSSLTGKRCFTTACPRALADLIHRYETMTGADALDLLFDEDPGEKKSHAEADVEPSQSGEILEMPAANHGATGTPAEPSAGNHPSRDDIAEGLAAALEEHRALFAEAEGRPVPSLASMPGGGRRPKPRSTRGNASTVERAMWPIAARLGCAFDFDEHVVGVVACLEAHEAEALAAFEEIRSAHGPPVTACEWNGGAKSESRISRNSGAEGSPCDREAAGQIGGPSCDAREVGRHRRRLTGGPSVGPPWSFRRRGQSVASLIAEPGNLRETRWWSRLPTPSRESPLVNAMPELLACAPMCTSIWTSPCRLSTT